MKLRKVSDRQWVVLGGNGTLPLADFESKDEAKEFMEMMNKSVQKQKEEERAKLIAMAGLSRNASRRIRRRDGYDSRKIKMLVDHNPKRHGTASWKRFNLYEDNMTVHAFLKAGGLEADVRYDQKNKFIELRG